MVDVPSSRRRHQRARDRDEELVKSKVSVCSASRPLGDVVQVEDARGIENGRWRGCSMKVGGPEHPRLVEARGGRSLPRAGSGRGWTPGSSARDTKSRHIRRTIWKRKLDCRAVRRPVRGIAGAQGGVSRRRRTAGLDSVERVGIMGTAEGWMEAGSRSTLGVEEGTGGRSGFADRLLTEPDQELDGHARNYRERSSSRTAPVFFGLRASPRVRRLLPEARLGA